MGTVTQQEPITKLDSLPESAEERKTLLDRFPRLIVTVAGRCRVYKSQVSRAYNGVHRIRAKSLRLRVALVNEINRRIENEHKAAGAKGNGGN